MSKLLSFFGGVAEGFIEEVDKSEKYGRETALSQMKMLAQNYEKTREENSKLTNELKGVEQWAKTVYGSEATPDQIAFLQSNPVAFQALKNLENPTKFKLNDIIAITAGNESKGMGAQRITELPALTEKVSTELQSKGFLARQYEDAETRAGATAERQFTRAYGTDAETMRNALPMQRPSVEGTFDMAKVLEKTPNSVEDMVKTANVVRVQAKQKYGEGSAEYKAANENFTLLSNEVEKVDKGLDARANRLNIAILDEQDPINKKALQSELKSVQQAIKDHKEAISTRAERNAGGAPADKTTLNSVQKSVAMFVDSRMRQDKGFDWAKHVDFKEIPLPDGGVYVSTTVKTTLPPEKQREVFEKIRMLEAEALKSNGYVVGGAPRNDKVKEFITNKNIPAEYYSGKAPATQPAQPSQPVVPTVVAAPAASPTRSFKTVAEAEAARLPKGTKITIGGRPAEVQ